jgi:hypothetical protein
MANDLAVRRALEAAGVEFIDGNGAGPGCACGRRIGTQNANNRSVSRPRLAEPCIACAIEWGERPEVYEMVRALRGRTPWSGDTVLDAELAESSVKNLVSGRFELGG